MKKLHFKLIPVFCVLILNACDFTGSSTPPSFEYELTSEGFFDVYLDSITSFQNTTTSVVNLNGEDHLAVMDNSSRNVNFYNLENSGKRFSVPLEPLGPSAILQPMSFYVHNLDSIFVYDFSHGVKLMDSKGKVYSHYDDIGLLRGIDYDFPTAMILNSLPMILKNGKIYYMPSSLDWDLKIMGAYDLNSRNEFEFIDYPSVLRSNRINNHFKIAFHAFTDDNIVVSFPLLDSLYVYTYEGAFVRKINASSSYFDSKQSYKEKEVVPRSPSAKQTSQYARTINENPSYFAVLYDRNSDLFYRFCSLPNSDDFSPDPRIRPFTITISDLDGKVLSELKIDNDNYMVGHPQVLGFIYKKKLYLQRRDVDNDDILRFEIFNPTKK